jgi:hypothetical protein
MLAPLRTLAPRDVRVWRAVYDVAARRGRLLLAAQALNRVRALDIEDAGEGAGNSPEMHWRLLHFRVVCASLRSLPATELAHTHVALGSHAPTPLPPPVANTLAALLSDASSEVLNAQFLQQRGADARGVLGAARGARVLGAPVAEVEGIALGALAEGVKLDLEVRLRLRALAHALPSPLLSFLSLLPCCVLTRVRTADGARDSRLPARARRAAHGRVPRRVRRALRARDSV